MNTKDLLKELNQYTIDVDKVCEFIRTCNNDDYTKISQALFNRRQGKINNAKLNMKPGMQVRIIGEKHKNDLFVIESIKVKNAIVRDLKTNAKWRVTLSLLEHVS